MTERSTILALAGTVSVILVVRYVQLFSQLQRSAAAKNKEKASSTVNVDDSSPPAPANCIYCDYNATTPIYPEIFQAMVPYLTKHFGNPSSSHSYGKIAKEALDRGRRLVSEVINAAHDNEVFFVSCGSEADNRCIDVALHNYQLALNAARESSNAANGSAASASAASFADGTLPVVVTSSIEHPAILCYLRILQQFRKRIDLRIVPVNEEGFIDLTAFEAALSPQVALVTIMHSNNEIGTIQPIRAISKSIKRYNKQNQTNILLHSDAAQSIGKVNVDVQQLGVDMLTIVGHKFGAPKGVGALYIREGVVVQPLLFGGSQEQGFRAGTENIPYIVALGEASRLAKGSTREYALRLLSLKLRFLKKLFRSFDEKAQQLVKLNGPKRSTNIQTIEEDLKVLKILLKEQQKGASPSTGNVATIDMLEQLPNTISLSFKSLIGHEIVEVLADQVACSTGSACHALPASHNSNVYSPSEVLLAIGTNADFGIGTIRISFGRFSNEEEVDSAAASIARTAMKMWKDKQLL